jgi:hypothetical protein
MSSLPPISSRNLLRLHIYKQQFDGKADEEHHDENALEVRRPTSARRGYIIEDKREGADDVRMAQIRRMRGGPGIKPGG